MKCSVQPAIEWFTSCDIIHQPVTLWRPAWRTPVAWNQTALDPRRLFPGLTGMKYPTKLCPTTHRTLASTLLTLTTTAAAMSTTAPTPAPTQDPSTSPTPATSAAKKPRRPPNPDTTISKALSYILRHGAHKEGLPLTPDGYAPVSTLLSLPRFKSLHLTLPTLLRIVAENDKQRYTLAPLPSDPTGYQIRASQGHSLPLEITHTPLLPSAPDFPDLIVHGTFYGAYESIITTGLSRMGRHHVHFAPYDQWKRGEVKSGMRGDAEVVVVVDARKMCEEGLAVERSDNGVVLCKGDGEGVVGVGFFVRVEERGGRVLWEKGVRVGELTEEQKAKMVPGGKGRRGGRGGGGGGTGGRGGDRGRGGRGKGNDGKRDGAAAAEGEGKSQVKTEATGNVDAALAGADET